MSDFNIVRSVKNLEDRIHTIELLVGKTPHDLEELGDISKRGFQGNLQLKEFVQLEIHRLDKRIEKLKHWIEKHV